MLVAVIDTHAVIWHLASDQQLSSNVKRFIEQAILERHQVGVSSITLVEMIYLIEKGKIPSSAFNNLTVELSRPNSVFLEIPVDRTIAATLQQVNVKQIPDMPDRIVAATALHFSVPLISRDRKIKLSTINTIW